MVYQREVCNGDVTTRRARNIATSPLIVSCRPVVTVARLLGNKSPSSFTRSATANAPTVHGRCDDIATAGRLVTAVSRVPRGAAHANIILTSCTREGGIVRGSRMRGECGVACAELSTEQRHNICIQCAHAFAGEKHIAEVARRIHTYAVVRYNTVTLEVIRICPYTSSCICDKR